MILKGSFVAIIGLLSGYLVRNHFDFLGISSGTSAYCNSDEHSCVGHRGRFKKFAVASDHPKCSEIGNFIASEKGGNIVDTGIATLLCLGVANFQSVGIGGGGFLLYHNAISNRTHFVNSRDKAPLKSSKDMFKDNLDAAVDGPLTITVPGEIAGLSEMHRRFGKLPWKELFAPSIELCTKGFPVGSGLVHAIRRRRDLILKYQNLTELLTNPETGEMYKLGDIIKLPKLAKTLQLIADEGSDVFYNGSLAADIVADIQDSGGIVTAEDLAEYRVKSEDALAIKLSDGNTLYTARPPSSGALLALIYNIMNGYKWRTDSLQCQNPSILFHHRLIEAWKYAFSIRYRMGDEEFVNVKEILKNITSIEFADHIRSLIDDNVTFDPEHYGPTEHTTDDRGTIHVSIMDSEGNAFSATSSIHLFFGSKIVGTRTGIFFNCGMNSFSIPGVNGESGYPMSPTNLIEPGKQSMSTMSPSIITDKDGDVELVVGASGGSKILSAVSYVALRTLLLNDNLKSAIDAPRVHHQWIPNSILHEWNIEEFLLSGLEAKGHELDLLPRSEQGAVVQALLRNHIEAYSDTRKGGCSAGTS